MIDIAFDTQNELDLVLSSNLDISLDMTEDFVVLNDIALEVKNGEVDVDMDASPLAVDLVFELGTIIDPSGLPKYEGPYVATPKVYSQIFETNEKIMEDDFTVLEIPYQEVSNPQGGETVIIAFIR